LCPKSYIGGKENELAQALSRELASGVRCHGHSWTSPADKKRKPFVIGDQRLVLQGYQDGPPAKSYRIVSRPSIRDYWAFMYGPPVSLLTDNGPQFTAKGFSSCM
jgi:hypothetical protein